MPNVKLLDTNTINKIAAGEVVERPASVVKELVENSIDAGAKRIEVEIQNGGKALIRVTDDGLGMSQEDAALAVKRHATSKLSTANDLQNIATLGFRGEALPTIAAVSKFTLQTRHVEDELGTKLRIDGGKTLETHEVGCKVGTTILVEELFFNTPARLKFLKTTPTEANKIHDFLVKLALSRPEVAFRFINGNRIALATPGTGNLLDTLSAIYGTELTDSLLPLSFDADDSLSLRGVVTKPNILKSHRGWQTFIINGRVVESRTISKAVDEAYTSLIPKTGFPLAVVVLKVPQTSIDVNVHPQKIELKFEDEGKIFKAVYHAVREAVEAKADAAHDLTEIAAAPVAPRFKQLDLQEELQEPTPPPKRERKPKPQDDLDFEKLLTTFDEPSPTIQPVEPPPPVEKPKPAQKPQPVKEPPPPATTSLELEPLGQVARCYIVAQGGNDLYLVDQHAAHERILFDKLSSYAERIPAQGLLIHRVMKFDSREAELIEKNLTVFAELGFTMEPSGVNEFRLVEVPVDASDADAENLLRGIIATIFNGLNEADDIAKKIRRAVLATTACKAAIKAGQELNVRQMEILLHDLSKTPHPHTCPHGRPTIIKFSAADLAKMFKRT